MSRILALLGLMFTCTCACAQDADLVRQLADRAAGKPPGAMYHVISNERISFVSPTEALYQSCWQTMRKGDEKRDGEWLIKSRKLVVFTDRLHPRPAGTGRRT